LFVLINAASFAGNGPFTAVFRLRTAAKGLSAVVLIGWSVVAAPMTPSDRPLMVVFAALMAVNGTFTAVDGALSAGDAPTIASKLLFWWKIQLLTSKNWLFDRFWYWI
jgi:hypothetical protein